MPKYAALIYGEEVDPATLTEEDVQSEMADYVEFGQVNGSSLRGGEALYPASTATTVHVEGGKGGNAVFTDGPFAETKEVLGGFYLLDCADLDEALKWAQQIPAAWMGGKVEVRPCVDFSGEADASQ